MRPPRDKLEKYTNIRSVAVVFDVSERTARRWLNDYNLLTTKPNFQPNKLKKKIKEIKAKHLAGVSSKELAKEYGVTITAIRRVIRGVTYPNKDFAIVQVIYNV